MDKATQLLSTQGISTGKNGTPYIAAGLTEEKKGVPWFEPPKRGLSIASQGVLMMQTLLLTVM